MAETNLDPEALPTNKMPEARKALAEGRYPRAYALCRLTLHADPRDLDANTMLADILVERQDFLGALGYVSNLVDINPGDMGARLRMATVLAGLGCYEATEQVMSQVSPGTQLAYDNLVRWIRQMLANGAQSGNPGIRAIPTGPGQSIRKFIRPSMPARERIANLVGLILARRGDAALWDNLGSVLVEEKDLLGAEAVLWRALALDPSDLAAYSLLARIHETVNENRMVDLIYSKGLEKAEPTADFVKRYGSFLTSEGKLRWPKAEQLYSDHAALGETDPAYLVAYANAKDNIGAFDDARELSEKALEKSRGSLPSLFGVFRYALTADNTDLARECLEQASQIKTDNRLVTTMEGMLASTTGDHETAVEKLRGEIDQAPAEGGIDLRARALFALGTSADKLKDHTLALQAFEAANEARRKQHDLPEDRGAGFIRHCDAVEAHFKDTSRDHSSTVKPTSGDVRHGVICGLPRSGTTLLDTFLRAHSDLALLEEEPFLIQSIHASVADRGGWANLRPITQEQSDEVRERYLTDVRALSREMVDTDYIVDRHPFNTPIVGAIRQALPEARIVFIARHPLDVAFSIFMQDFQLGDALANGITIKGALTLYDAMMRAFKAGVDATGADVLYIRYEDLIVDPKAVLSRVTDHLGVEWQDDILDHQKSAEARGRIRTASHSQVRQPIFQSARYRWKNYTFALDEHRHLVDRWIDFFDYTEAG